LSEEISLLSMNRPLKQSNWRLSFTDLIQKCVRSVARMEMGGSVLGHSTRWHDRTAIHAAGVQLHSL
jgi:hypothetical protein